MNTNKPARWPFLMASGLFSIFAINILVGKYTMTVGGRDLPLSLGGVVEFLLLLATCIFFVVGIIRSEAAKPSIDQE